MLSGKLPFTGDTEAATWKSVVTADPPPLPPHVSSDVKKLVTILLSKSADRRPSVDQIVLTKLVTRYVKHLVGYGRMAKNQYEVIKGPSVTGEEGEGESKPSIPRMKRGPVKEEAPPKERGTEKGVVEVKGEAGKFPEEKPASKGSKEEVKAEMKEAAAISVKKEAEAPK